MWWECRECGGHVERPRTPVVCDDCGHHFVPVDIDDPLADDPDADSMRAVWLRVGLEQRRLGLGGPR
jgi:hypothetical protein